MAFDLFGVAGQRELAEYRRDDAAAVGDAWRTAGRAIETATNKFAKSERIDVRG